MNLTSDLKIGKNFAILKSELQPESRQGVVCSSDILGKEWFCFTLHSCHCFVLLLFLLQSYF